MALWDTMNDSGVLGVEWVTRSKASVRESECINVKRKKGDKVKLYSRERDAVAFSCGRKCGD